MKLDDLAQAFANTTMDVRDKHLIISRLASGHYNQADADFVAIAISHWPNLLAVAKAATRNSSATTYGKIAMVSPLPLVLLNLC